MDLKENEKLKMYFNSNKILLITTIIFLILTVVSVYFAIKVKNDAKGIEAIDMLEINEKDKYSYINNYYEPYYFAIDNNNYDKYYIVSDENYLYIAILDIDTYEKIVSSINNDTSYKIVGMTKYISDDLRDLAIESYNELMEEEFLTKDNFYEYFGLVYLDTKALNYDNSLQIMLAITSGTIFLILFILSIIIIPKTIKTLKKLDDQEKMELENELNNECTIYKKIKMIITKNYILFNSNGLCILKLKDILWIYEQTVIYNGVRYRILYLHTINKKYNIQLNNTKQYVTIDDISKIIKEKNNNLLIGNTKENKQIYKSLKK